MDDDYDDGKYDEHDGGCKTISKKSNVLPLWGNERSMNLNPLILTNIQSSHYFKVNLYELKTYHEVIDEIYYKVNHLEPWEKGSRKTAGQTGMCGGVRGVGAGGIVSTAFCLLYKLFTLKLSRKQVIGLITHPDSPYIRVLGFMYIRYTQPPADLWDWYDEYLDDLEELDVKAGGGQVMTIGNILKNFLCKLEWFSTLFPRIPVPIQQKLERKMNERYPPVGLNSKAFGNANATWNKPSNDCHYSSENRLQSRSTRLSPFRDRDDRSQDKRCYKEEPRYSRERSRKSQSTYEERRYRSRSGKSRDNSVEFKYRNRSRSGSNFESRCRSRSEERKKYDKTYGSHSKSRNLTAHQKHNENGHRNKEVSHFRNDHPKHEDEDEKKHRREIDNIIRRHKESYRRSPKERTDEKYLFDERDRDSDDDNDDRDGQKHKHNRRHSPRRSSSYEKKRSHKKGRGKHSSDNHKRSKNC